MARPSSPSKGSKPEPPHDEARPEGSTEEADDVDLALRLVSRRLADDLARALLSTPSARARWLETQLAGRQRRLDRLLEARVEHRRRWLHVEWQRAWEASVPLRVFEYQFLAALAAADEHPPAPCVESVVVLLTGRRRRWPSELRYRVSPPGARFSGARFRLEAVYQQTASALMAKGLLFTLFVPLAEDADERAVRRAAALLKERAQTETELADLGAAMTVLAEADGRSRGLGRVVLELLDSDLVMHSSIYSMGREAGRKEGKLEGKLEGRVEAQRETLRRAIEALCEVLAVRLTPGRKAQLMSFDDTALEGVFEALRDEKRWPRRTR